MASASCKSTAGPLAGDWNRPRTRWNAVLAGRSLQMLESNVSYFLGLGYTHFDLEYFLRTGRWPTFRAPETLKLRGVRYHSQTRILRRTPIERKIEIRRRSPGVNAARRTALTKRVRVYGFAEKAKRASRLNKFFREKGTEPTGWR